MKAVLNYFPKPQKQRKRLIAAIVAAGALLGGGLYVYWRRGNANGNANGYPIVRQWTVRDASPPRFSDNDIESDPSFQFTFSRASWGSGYWITIQAAGDISVDYSYRGRQDGKATFKVPLNDVADLRHLLSQLHFTTLPHEFHKDIYDAGQGNTSVTIRGDTKEVSWDAWFPQEFTEIRHFVETRILEPNVPTILRQVPNAVRQDMPW